MPINHYVKLNNLKLKERWYEKEDLLYNENFKLILQF